MRESSPPGQLDEGLPAHQRIPRSVRLAPRWLRGHQPDGWVELGLARWMRVESRSGGNGNALDGQAVPASPTRPSRIFGRDEVNSCCRLRWNHPCAWGYPLDLALGYQPRKGIADLLSLEPVVAGLSEPLPDLDG